MILRAIEEKRSLPVGSDKEATSDFELIAGTNRDLSAAVAKVQFREDLLARLDLWTFSLPCLKDRREDIEPNIAYELARHARVAAIQLPYDKEARARYLHFATSPAAAWTANFRDLAASITRMATLAPSGRRRRRDRRRRNRTPEAQVGRIRAQCRRRYTCCASRA